MTVKLWRHGERIVMSTPWAPDAADRAKLIAGSNWSKPSRTWSYPLTMHTLRRLREVYGDDIEVEAGLMLWARRAARRERELKRLAGQDDANLLRVARMAPKLAEAMGTRTYQRVGARFGAVAGSWLLADEPGLGKTAQALGALIEGDRWHGDHLVIAPKAGLDTVWRRQINLWTPDAEVVAVPEGAAAREKALERFWLLDDPKFLVINLAMIRRLYGKFCKVCETWEGDKGIPPEHYIESGHKFRRAIRTQSWPDILDHGWESVILDESHEALAAYNPSNITMTTTGLLDLASESRIALTGTPLRGSEKRIWGTLDWLGVKTGGYWAFIDDLFEVGNNGFGKVVYGIDPARREAFERMIDGVVLRRTRAEVRPDLPMGQRLDVMVEMDAKHREQYEEFELMGETALESGLIAGQGTLSELTRLKQLAWGRWTESPTDRSHLIPTLESPKWPWIVQFLRERGITGTKINDWMPEPGLGYKYIIASHETEVLDAIELGLTKLKIPTLKITGAVTGKRRTSVQNVFQSDDEKFRVMLINTQTGGSSIDLDAWCDEMIILDETWIADDQVQLEGRINNRSGRVAPRTWWYVRTADTIEESIAESNYHQHSLQHDLLDGRRGVELALHLIRGGKS